MNGNTRIYFFHGTDSPHPPKLGTSWLDGKETCMMPRIALGVQYTLSKNISLYSLVLYGQKFLETIFKIDSVASKNKFISSQRLGIYIIRRIWLNGVVDETLRDFLPNVCKVLQLVCRE